MTALPLIGLALAGAGTGLGVSASISEKNAMNDKLHQEMLRQQAYQKKAGGAFDTSLAESTPQASQRQWDAQTQRAMDEYQKVSQVPLSSATAMNGGTVAIPNRNAVVQDQSNQQFQQLMARPNAVMQGQGGYSLAQHLKDLTANQGIGVQSGFAQRSGGVLPYELQAASQSKGTQAGVGQLLGALGSLMSIYGAVGGMRGIGAAATPGALGASQAAYGGGPGAFSMQRSPMAWGMTPISPY